MVLDPVLWRELRPYTATPFTYVVLLRHWA